MEAIVRFIDYCYDLEHRQHLGEDLKVGYLCELMAKRLGFGRTKAYEIMAMIRESA